MRIKRFIRRPLIWLSTTLEQRMKTAALPHKWISTSNSTSSSSVRLPWKASSFEVPLCCVLLYLANPVVEPQATRGVILSMFSITLFALIRLPCAHALTYVWKTFGSPWQDVPSLARGHQNHPSPLDSESLHYHLRGVEAPFYTLRNSLFLLQESNPSSTWPLTPGIQEKAAFLLYLLQSVPAVQGDIQPLWERSWIHPPWLPLWMAARDALNLHTRCIYLAVCASWGYWHEEHVTNNGVSSLSPATTGCNGHVLWFLGILNTSGPIPPQHWAPKLDCRPLWRFVYLPSFFSPSTKKEPVSRSLLTPPQKWLSRTASRMEKLPPLLLASTVWSSRTFLKNQALSGSMLQSLVPGILVMAEKFLSASLHFYTAWLEQICLLRS